MIFNELVRGKWYKQYKDGNEYIFQFDKILNGNLYAFYDVDFHIVNGKILHRLGYGLYTSDIILKKEIFEIVEEEDIIQYLPKNHHIVIKYRKKRIHLLLNV